MVMVTGQGFLSMAVSESEVNTVRLQEARTAGATHGS